MMRVLVTGGCGFIGSHLIRRLLRPADIHEPVEVLNLDKLTYAASLATVADVSTRSGYHFCQGDIADERLVSQLLNDFRPQAVIHLAAESHVDRSIDSPDAFIETNIVGTYRLLDASLQYWATLTADDRQRFRWIQVSTDEVYGSLGSEGLFTEATAYDPHSPYAASKAAGDHLVRAWHTTYQLPVMVTNSSNNYGAFQFPEKLIPHMILNAIHHRPLPVYGDGSHVRDWLYVEDHVSGLERVLRQGQPGHTYNLGANCQLRNIDLVKSICQHLDQLAPWSEGTYQQLIRLVPDRPGHDARYAIDASKITRELQWQANTQFTDGLRQTIQWYLDNPAWWQPILDGTYRLERLGHREPLTTHQPGQP